MNYRPSRGLIFCLVPLLAAGGTGAWAWNKANDAPTDERAKGDFIALVKRKRDASAEAQDESPAARKALREGCAAMKAKMLLEHPGLQVEAAPVPAEENAFLELYKLAAYPKGTGPGFESLRVLLDDSNLAWDPERAKAALAANADWVERAERIAAMTSRSSTDMPADYNGFFSARASKALADTLMLKARLAAEAGDTGEVLRLVGATRNLGSHLHEVEQPTLLGETVRVLVDLSMIHRAFDHLLPELGPDTDLKPWKHALGSSGYSPADFAHVIRGEWHATAEYYLYPVILRQKPSDGETLARVHAANFEQFVADLRGMSWPEFASQGCEHLTSGTSGLSGKSQEIFETFQVGAQAWNKGYLRAVSVTALHEAAIDLMILEQSGETLSVESVAELESDPVSGLSYRFDPATRTLSAPEAIEAANVKPVKLPW
jgi:hypothetical protein